MKENLDKLFDTVPIKEKETNFANGKRIVHETYLDGTVRVSTEQVINDKETLIEDVR